MRSDTKYMWINGDLVKVSVEMIDVGVGTAIRIEAYNTRGEEVFLTAAEATEACKGI